MEVSCFLFLPGSLFSCLHFEFLGGGGICLGRFLAKNALLIVLAYLVLEYEMEPLVDKMVVDPWRYGLAVDHPKHPTAFRIRRRL